MTAAPAAEAWGVTPPQIHKSCLKEDLRGIRERIWEEVHPEELE
jgi:hypothetical protein